jgi:hypothetical protein
MAFVLAVPNIRGGGEFGEEWHLAGTRERKVRGFNEFGGLAIELSRMSEGKLLRRLHRGFVSFSSAHRNAANTIVNFREWLIENKYAARGKSRHQWRFEWRCVDLPINLTSWPTSGHHIDRAARLRLREPRP